MRLCVCVSLSLCGCSCTNYLISSRAITHSERAALTRHLMGDQISSTLSCRVQRVAPAQKKSDTDTRAR